MEQLHLQSDSGGGIAMFMECATARLPPETQHQSNYAKSPQPAEKSRALPQRFK